jgi:ribosome-associated protein
MSKEGVAINPEQRVERIVAVLNDLKAENVVTVDVRGRSSVTDYYIVATGTSSPHLKALYNGVDVALKHAGSPSYRRSGDPEGGWVVLDYVDVIVHVLTQAAREYYTLEALWQKKPAAG